MTYAVPFFHLEQAEAHAFSLAVREGLQPLLRVLRYKADEGEIRQTVREGRRDGRALNYNFPLYVVKNLLSFASLFFQMQFAEKTRRGERGTGSLYYQSLVPNTHP